MLPAIGDWVHYVLSEHDVAAISTPGPRTGNFVAVGQTYPALVVRTFGGPAANLQVHLDGPDSYWATSRTEGDQPGTWAWRPPRVEE
jgi:hypothetical protein